MSGPFRVDKSGKSATTPTTRIDADTKFSAEIQVQRHVMTKFSESFCTREYLKKLIVANTPSSTTYAAEVGHYMYLCI